MSWIDVGALASVPLRGARVLRVHGQKIAVFRTGGDEVFALRDQCPHRGGPLSQGIVHADRVTCPLHEWVIDLRTGRATGADEGCTHTFGVRIESGRVLVDVPEIQHLARDDDEAGVAVTDTPGLAQIDVRACPGARRAG